MVSEQGRTSFVTVEQADDYFDRQFNNSDWFATNVQNEEALVTASGILNRLGWKGTATPTSTYPLAWPRNITTFVPLNGTNVTLTDDRTATSFGTIPQFIQDATCELALHIIRNGVNNLANDSGAPAVRDLTVGTIRLTFDLSDRKSYIDLPEIVYSIISPYLANSVRTGIGTFVNGGA